MSDDELVIRVASAKSKILTEILLPRLGVGLNAATTKLFDKPAGQIVAVTAIVDEVVLALRRVEGRTLESNHGANFGHTCAAA